MSTKIRFPNTRLTQTGLGNPLFVTDVENLTSNLLEAINMLLGLPASGATAFAILSGFTYTPGGGGSYSAGIVYMNGLIYYFDDTGGELVEGKYLSPVPTDGNSKVFSDGNSYNTYRIYYAVSSNSQVGGMPQFTGTMDRYRLSLTAMKGDTVDKVPVIGADLTAALPLFANNQKKVETLAATDARIILDVFSKAENGGLLTKVVDIGDWNMDATDTVNVVHGLTASKIREVSVFIRNDDDSFGIPLLCQANNTNAIIRGSANIVLSRTTGDIFDNVGYDLTSYNRGWVIIKYIP
jgi:hypothetical protein